MPNWLSRQQALALIFALLVFAAILKGTDLTVPGWDVGVYAKAMQSLRAGHDPYAEAIAVQRAYHSLPVHERAADPPWSYVYSPITLAPLRLIGALPLWLSGGVYWLVFAVAVFGTIWLGWQAGEPNERRYLAFAAPAATLFPGLLFNGIILGGNIAYILYGAIFLAAAVGWRRGQWRWFYIAVLAASCVKAPLLSLLAIPILSARKQWLGTGITAALGVAIFAAQPRIWPGPFARYLEAVELQFSFNRDFGSSPAGVFSGILQDHAIPYPTASLIFYLCYAIPLFGFLFYLSRKHLAGRLSLKEWLPVLLLGVLLFNPRIIEYDAAPITVPMALIGWRFLTSLTTPVRAGIAFGIFFAIANIVANVSWDVRKLVEAAVFLLFFAAGSWNLLRRLWGYTLPKVSSHHKASPVSVN